MRRLDVITAAILVPIDFMMVVLAGVTAYALRFSGTVANLRPVIAELPLQSYFVIVLIIGVVWVACFAMAGLYSIRHRLAITEVGRIIIASSAAMMLIILVIFFRRELFSSRFIVLAGWLLAILYLTISRMVIRGIRSAIQHRGLGLQALLVVGSGELPDRMVSEMFKGHGEGFKCVGRLANFDAAAQQEFQKLLDEKKPDAVFLASTQMPQTDVLALLDAAHNRHLDFYYIADLFSTHASHLSVSTLFGEPVVEVQRTPLDGWGRIWKRTFDCVASALGLIILSPFFLIISILIKLDSRGQVFARLIRVGARGKTFNLYKFRSMIKNAHELKSTLMDKNERQDGPLFKMSNDPRITRMGRFIRRTSIDELPQLWNVLRGQMSLVGPRPHEPEEIARYQSWHRKLLTIKPGMSGMAQVRGRAALTFDEEARLDIAYIENWSFALDLMILLKTPAAVLSRRAAV
jgi:exopolysaccharide biosynthesis polyprenyl glycosylphosphotransferase